MMWRRYFITLTILFLGFNLLAQKSKDSLEFANFYYDALKYLAIENNEMALQQLERCSELIDDNASTLFLRGKILTEQGKLDEAEKLLEKAYKVDTDNHWYLKALAKVFFDKGENDKAFELYTKSLENDPNSEELHLSLAKLYEGNNMYEKALEHYQKYCALQGNPDKQLMKCASTV